MVVPEKDPVQKWADKNGVEGDMDSWCTNEVLYDAFVLAGNVRRQPVVFGGKCPPPDRHFWREKSLARPLSLVGNLCFSAGNFPHFSIFFCLGNNR